MTPKQEREWAQGVLEAIASDGAAFSWLAYIEFAGIVRALADGEKLLDKAYARKVTSTFEDLIQMRKAQKGEITTEEFWDGLKAKAKAKVDKQWSDRRSRRERRLYSKRKTSKC